MNGSYHDSDWTEKVTIPVKKIGGQWEFFYGGAVPVKEGALADLVVNASQVSDPDFLKRLQQKAVVKVLEQGTKLLVALSDPDGISITAEQRELINRDDMPAGATRFVPVYLGPSKKGVTATKLDNMFDEPSSGGLWLKVRGLDKTDLISSSIDMPSEVSKKPAISLNHALTMLSEHYETHRLSHTGNVYTRVFYQEKSGRWYPLSDLREGVLGDAERQLIAESWKQLETLIGWRPLVKPSKRKS